MKDVIIEMNNLKKKSKALRSNAIDKNVSFDESQKIREEQTKIYDKYVFYKGFINAASKKEGEIK